MLKYKSTLHFICGKLGSGKTTLAKQLVDELGLILISEDIWLEKLYPNEINEFKDYLLYSRRFREIIASHACDLLQKGISLVFDFGVNTPEERQWVKSIIDRSSAKHVLHYIDVTDELCLTRIKKRNRELPVGSTKVSKELFGMINRYFIPPDKNEGFNIMLHKQQEK